MLHKIHMKRLGLSALSSAPLFSDINNKLWHHRHDVTSALRQWLKKSTGHLSTMTNQKISLQCTCYFWLFIFIFNNNGSNWMYCYSTIFQHSLCHNSYFHYLVGSACLFPLEKGLCLVLSATQVTTASTS